MIKVLFVCLGNICRSPSAEAVFQGLVDDRAYSELIKVDSCGTAAYHVGEPPDPRSILAAEARGYEISHLRARQFTSNDFFNFDYILCMDNSNLSNVLDQQPLEESDKRQGKLAEVSLLLDFFDGGESGLEVPDPYYGGDRGFDQVLDLIETAGKNLLDHILQQDLKA